MPTGTVAGKGKLDAVPIRYLADRVGIPKRRAWRAAMPAGARWSQQAPT
jgi:hypothetical protein